MTVEVRSPLQSAAMSETKPILRAEGLTVAYGNFVALDRFDAVLEGGSCGLLGPNGAGKSSLLRALLGFLTAPVRQPLKNSRRLRMVRSCPHVHNYSR